MEDGSHNEGRNDGKDRLVHLAAPVRKKKIFGTRYSKIVRWGRLILPTVALALLAVVFTWSNKENNIVTPQDPKKIENVMGKNELINPRFESTDDKNQPFTLTAARAVQDEKDAKLLILEKPKADLAMNSGNWVAFESTEGAYQQKEGKILLRGGVRFFHDGGYQMDTQELHINVNDETAMTDKDVFLQGPEGTLSAKGLEGHNKDNTLVFKGPVKVVVDTKSLNSGGFLR